VCDVRCTMDDGGWTGQWSPHLGLGGSNIEVCSTWKGRRATRGEIWRGLEGSGEVSRGPDRPSPTPDSSPSPSPGLGTGTGTGTVVAPRTGLQPDADCAEVISHSQRPVGLGGVHCHSRWSVFRDLWCMASVSPRCVTQWLDVSWRAVTSRPSSQDACRMHAPSGLAFTPLPDRVTQLALRGVESMLTPPFPPHQPSPLRLQPSLITLPDGRAVGVHQGGKQGTPV
jgi:hypothetical protein